MKPCDCALRARAHAVTLAYLAIQIRQNTLSDPDWRNSQKIIGMMLGSDWTRGWWMTYGHIVNVLLGLFVAVTIGALAAIVAFFVGMLVFASGQDQMGGLAMIVAPLIAFGGGALYGWRLIRRATAGRRDGG